MSSITEKDLYVFHNLLIKEKLELSTGAIALWYALKGWEKYEGQEFTINVESLQALTGLSGKGVRNARDMLVNCGLVEYTSFQNKPGIYKLKPWSYSNSLPNILPSKSADGKMLPPNELPPNNLPPNILPSESANNGLLPNILPSESAENDSVPNILPSKSADGKMLPPNKLPPNKLPSEKDNVFKSTTGKFRALTAKKEN